MRDPDRKMLEWHYDDDGRVIDGFEWTGEDFVDLPRRERHYADLAYSKAVFEELYGEFPFKDQRSKAVQIMATLAPWCRVANPALAACNYPVTCWTANSQRAGKTLLAKAVLIPFCREFRAQSLPNNEEEIRKIIDSSVRDLRNGHCLIFDNIKHRIQSAVLEAFLTTSSWSGRILGQTKTFTSKRKMMVYMTANNANVSADIAGRTVFCELWIKEGDPQSRKIKRVLSERWLHSHKYRVRIQAAVSGLIQNWIDVGFPATPSRLAGFEDYSEQIGGIVYAAGYGDPMEPPKMEDAGDEDTKDLLALLAIIGEGQDGVSWFGKELTMNELAGLCHDAGLFEYAVDGGIPRTGAYFELSHKGRARFGRLLGAYKNRVFRVDI